MDNKQKSDDFKAAVLGGKMVNKGFVIEKRITDCLCKDPKRYELLVLPDEDFDEVFQDLTEGYLPGQCDHGEPWEHEGSCGHCLATITFQRWFVVVDRVPVFGED